MKIRLIIIPLIACIAALLSFFWIYKAHAPVVTLDYHTVTLTSNAGETRAILVEIADTDTERAAGLMFRKSLPTGTGMLFVYDREIMMNFWMKNTLIPLDIFFFDTDGKFVSGSQMTPCITDPCMTYSSGKPARYALEMARGELEATNINENWTLALK